MGVHLTLDVFSGRPNPRVELEGAEAQDLLERLAPGRLLDEDVAEAPPSHLGYRGIIVEQSDGLRDDVPPAFRFAVGNLYGRGLAHRARDESVEEYLLSADGPFAGLELTDDDFFGKTLELREATLELVRERWLEEWVYWPLALACKCGPLYEPGWWNVPSRQPFNNCYNYSTNYRTDTFAQPGRAAGAQYTSLTCNDVLPAAVADQLIDTPSADNSCPDEGHLVALVVAPGWDYHWYRKDRTGWWSHKPGSTAVTNRDNAGKAILDPRHADRGPYTDFCTFMVVMHGHIKIS